MKKPQVIVADIDNTLVLKHHDLSKRTADIIDALKNNGIYFGMASGRPKNDLYPVLDRWQHSYDYYDFLICSNGCLLIDNLAHKEYEYFYLQPLQIKTIIELMKPFNCNPTVSIDGQTWSAFYDQYVANAEKYLGKKTFICQSEDYHELWQKPVGKIMFRTTDEQIKVIEEYCKKYCPGDIIGFRTDTGVFEFTDSRANKGVALKQFCRLHNINLDDTWAFGDTTNDNQMLIDAGVGICLLNGSADTKNCADYITEYGVENDGFADFIEKNIDLVNNS